MSKKKVIFIHIFMIDNKRNGLNFSGAFVNMHQAITWINVDLSLVKSLGIYRWEISEWNIAEIHQ